MKRVIILFAFLISVGSFAQEKKKNTETETVTTKKTVTDNKGSRTSTKTESQTKNINMRLADEDANKVNQMVILDPEEVDTNVSYDFGGEQFQFLNQEDREGYRLMTVKDNTSNKEYAIIKPTSQEGYFIISKEGQSSFGYFNDEGNFIVERYDQKQDKIVTDVYKIDKKALEKKK